MTGHVSKPNDWKKFPKSLIEKGTKVEMEHTKSKVIARRIATDHIVEMGDKYYDELFKMEKKLSKKNKLKN